MDRHLSREALLQVLLGKAGEVETARAIRHVVQCRRCRESAAGCLAQERADGTPSFRPADARGALVTLLEASSVFLRPSDDPPASSGPPA